MCPFSSSRIIIIKATFDPSESKYVKMCVNKIMPYIVFTFHLVMITPSFSNLLCIHFMNSCVKIKDSGEHVFRTKNNMNLATYFPPLNLAKELGHEFLDPFEIYRAGFIFFSNVYPFPWPSPKKLECLGRLVWTHYLP